MSRVKYGIYIPNLIVFRFIKKEKDPVKLSEIAENLIHMVQLEDDRASEEAVDAIKVLLTNENLPVNKVVQLIGCSFPIAKFAVRTRPSNGTLSTVWHTYKDVIVDSEGKVTQPSLLRNILRGKEESQLPEDMILDIIDYLARHPKNERFLLLAARAGFRQDKVKQALRGIEWLQHRRRTKMERIFNGG